VRLPIPRRTVSTEVMKSLLARPGSFQLGGERRRVTILITDLRGFTALAERVRPEEFIALLNAYFEVMVDVCLRHGGNEQRPRFRKDPSTVPPASTRIVCPATSPARSHSTYAASRVLLLFATLAPPAEAQRCRRPADSSNPDDQTSISEGLGMRSKDSVPLSIAAPDAQSTFQSSGSIPVCQVMRSRQGFALSSESWSPTPMMFTRSARVDPQHLKKSFRQATDLCAT
jgi:hypothetical protein